MLRAVRFFRSSGSGVMTGIIVRMFLLAVAFGAMLALQGCGKSILPSIVGSPHDSASGGAVVEKARSQLGARYKYGGASPGTGFDCSGLIHWSYAACGVNVPRNTDDQSRVGAGVKKSHLRAGDILVFRISSRSGLHTAIYSGNGKFIHSPSSGKRIREDTLDTDYWARRYVTARRIL